jgi:hypothetical protein
VYDQDADTHLNANLQHWSIGCIVYIVSNINLKAISESISTTNLDGCTLYTCTVYTIYIAHCINKNLNNLICSVFVKMNYAYP